MNSIFIKIQNNLILNICVDVLDQQLKENNKNKEDKKEENTNIEEKKSDNNVEEKFSSPSIETKNKNEYIRKEIENPLSVKKRNF